jgi:hypothetical protein
MAINYKWEIPKMNAHIEAEGEENVIYEVQYKYTGTKESDGNMYSSVNSGTQGYTYVAGAPFAPYENSEAFEAIVIGWLEGSLDVSQMQADITANIQHQINPVNKKLQFTWNGSFSAPVIVEAVDGSF